jgi:heterodisulfide reductase subunit A
VTERIGVYICECGPNISGVLQTGPLATWANSLPGVVAAACCPLLCAKQGHAFLRREIQTHHLTRVVVAGCSPKEHQDTFRKVLQDAGLNGFLLQIANIREQCAWVTSDPKKAQVKSMALIRAAVDRVVHHKPLTIKDIEACADVLVVGAGVCGISAALALAKDGRRVFLVEARPCIGGQAALWQDLFPSMNCASCLLDPLLDQVLHHDRIQVMTLSRVEEVRGGFGNFTVRVREAYRGVNAVSCLGCGLCVEACPVTVPNDFNQGLDTRKAIFIAYPGALPNVAVIDAPHCLRSQDTDCKACQEVCPFGAVDFSRIDQIHRLNVGAVVLATGFSLMDLSGAPRYGCRRYPAVKTAAEFERIINCNGPTGGKLVTAGGRIPQHIVFVHCAGSRDLEFAEHCSGICCKVLIKSAHQARQLLPEAEITNLYVDLCLAGKKAQSFYRRVQMQDRVAFVRMQAPNALQIAPESDAVRIDYTAACGQPGMLMADMVVVAPAMIGGADAPRLSGLFDLETDSTGFFISEAAMLAPVATVRRGVYAAGCAIGPCSIAESVAQGQAAAAGILGDLVPGRRIALEPAAAYVKSQFCSGCAVCVDICPFKAISCGGKTPEAAIDETLCRGCGICVAACPSGAIFAGNDTDAALSAEIRAVAGDSRKDPDDSL